MEETKGTIMMVEVGRVAYVTHGPLKNLPCVIIEILDTNRCYVDGGGVSSVPRMIIGYNDLSLLPYVLKVSKNATTEELKKVIGETKVYELFLKSSVGKCFAKGSKIKELKDFDRFKYQYLQKKKEEIVKKAAQKYLTDDYKARTDDYIFEKKIKKAHHTMKLKRWRKKQINYHVNRKQYLLRYRPLLKGLY